MKKTLLITFTLLIIAACGSGSQTEEKSITVADANTVYLYYFHGKQRCKTCIAVEKLTKEVIDSIYKDQPKVQLKVLLTEEPANLELIEKYQISWNSLIIAKGEDSINITEEAFANAISSPELLVDLIQEEVNSRL
ncbi:MAG: nitrophenyl compound nitroreductase subunit ArsF family protein [Bacteroidales bacterium]|nr:nitrophenyl compound nitroreductase subunit ArsF family protein [Bacteroidales bacterium]